MGRQGGGVGLPAPRPLPRSETVAAHSTSPSETRAAHHCSEAEPERRFWSQRLGEECWQENRIGEEPSGVVCPDPQGVPESEFHHRGCSTQTWGQSQSGTQDACHGEAGDPAFQVSPGQMAPIGPRPSSWKRCRCGPLAVTNSTCSNTDHGHKW